jgi:polyribonucleotide nucleotidyltransferase
VLAEKFEFQLGTEKTIIETGRIAKQADGAVTVQCGGTVILVAAVMSKEVREDVDFFPLTVDYQEKTYAAGKIPGGFFKREGRPSEIEVLTSRLIDRPVRPLFPEGFINEVQIVATVLSSDGENDPDVLSIIGASCALSISGIPFLGPIGAVRIGRFEGNFVINPTRSQMEGSDIDLVIAGTGNGIIMIEGSAREVSEEEIVNAIEFGYKGVMEIVDFQRKIVAACGRPKMQPVLSTISDELCSKVKEVVALRLGDVTRLAAKEQREDEIAAITKELTEKFISEGLKYESSQIKAAVRKAEKEMVRRYILDKGVRVDGREYAAIRPITCEVGILPRTHGSGLFTRGQTQSLTVTTLGTSADEQMIDALDGEEFKSFMLHYNFPPFSVGEVRPIRGPGRREIGHGALAERALKPVMPSKEEFPYTVRVVSDILESNGSTSMATVCGATLSLMDAGVPIKAPVSGIAMGLVKEDSRFSILTDIMGIEDYNGDMDFKVAGSSKGITALQMDIKISGVRVDIIEQALTQARPARLFILGKMLEVLPAARASISAYAPRITVMEINPERIKDVIGPGGKIIKKIISETGATIDIEDSGKISIASPDPEASRKTIEMINKLVEEVEVGKIYPGKVKRVMNFGAFCEILPGKEGLVHISELSDKFVKNVEDVVKVGDEIAVKVVEIDGQGRINLSRKQAMEPDLSRVTSDRNSTVTPAPKHKRFTGERDTDKGKTKP